MRNNRSWLGSWSVVLLYLVLSTISSTLRAETEGEMIEAVQKENHFRALEILKKWAVDPSRQDLVSRYAGREMPGNMGRTTNEFAAWVVERKVEAHYRTAVQSALNGDSPDAKKNDALLTAVTARMSDSEAMRKSVAATMTIQERQGTGQVRRLFIPVYRDAFRMAAAAHAAQALGGVTEVKIGSSGAMPLTGGDQIDWDKFPDYVLSGNRTELFAQLESYRAGLGTTTQPTRAAVTQKMLDYAGQAPPDNARALREAVRNRLVKSQVSDYASATRPPEKLRTLNVSLVDESDLRLARLIDQSQDTWSGNVKGLGDVQMVKFSGMTEVSPDAPKAQYPREHQVLDEDGRRISDIVAPKNFVAAPGRENEGGLWREPKFRLRGYEYDARRVFDCNGPRVKMGTAQTQEN